ncbi:hypothetical protein F383_33516 [Gossypium arboreum]|uniref:Uncharacterized protein n=1 Tax=Gossypium arboreum TaxID=29729 RepID=A0A0B0N1P8_GOSAR|nr:hypothetical protein F383_33516 [Gossypium arboreum]
MDDKLRSRRSPEAGRGGDGNDGGEERVAGDPRERSPLIPKGSQGRWLHEMHLRWKPSVSQILLLLENLSPKNKKKKTKKEVELEGKLKSIT